MSRRPPPPFELELQPRLFTGQGPGGTLSLATLPMFRQPTTPADALYSGPRTRQPGHQPPPAAPPL